MTTQNDRMERYGDRTCVRIAGKTRRSRSDPWNDVICFVSYKDAKQHEQIVSDMFQYHLRLDIEYIKCHYRSHFTEPHNVAHAILLYHYFRERHRFFDYGHCAYVPALALPDREPDVAEEGLAIWIQADPI